MQEKRQCRKWTVSSTISPLFFKHPASHSTPCWRQLSGAEQGKGILETPTSPTQYLNTGKDATNLVRNTWKQPTDGHRKKAEMEHRAVKLRLHVLSYKARRTGEKGHQGIHTAPPNVAEFSQCSLLPMNDNWRD